MASRSSSSSSKTSRRCARPRERRFRARLVRDADAETGRRTAAAAQSHPFRRRTAESAVLSPRQKPELLQPRTRWRHWNSPADSVVTGVRPAPEPIDRVRRPVLGRNPVHERHEALRHAVAGAAALTATNHTSCCSAENLIMVHRAKIYPVQKTVA